MGRRGVIRGTVGGGRGLPERGTRDVVIYKQAPLMTQQDSQGIMTPARTAAMAPAIRMNVRMSLVLSMPAPYPSRTGDRRSRGGAPRVEEDSRGEPLPGVRTACTLREQETHELGRCPAQTWRRTQLLLQRCVLRCSCPYYTPKPSQSERLLVTSSARRVYEAV